MAIFSGHSQVNPAQFGSTLIKISFVCVCYELKKKPYSFGTQQFYKKKNRTRGLEIGTLCHKGVL